MDAAKEVVADVLVLVVLKLLVSVGEEVMEDDDVVLLLLLVLEEVVVALLLLDDEELVELAYKNMRISPTHHEALGSSTMQAPATKNREPRMIGSGGVWDCSVRA